MYRFALLLCGDSDAAAQLLSAVLTELAPQLEQFRNEKSREVFVFRKIRERCMKSAKTAGVPDPGAALDETAQFAKKFCAIREPDRSALALFYLDIFPARDAALLLGVSIEEYSDALANGRESLRLTGLALSKEETR